MAFIIVVVGVPTRAARVGWRSHNSMQESKSIIVPRALLLIEVDRHCFFADCNARVLIGLTRQEAFSYSGFECVLCKRWNDDHLTEKDVPDWWAEINQCL
jgi:hypothetical protein